MFLLVLESAPLVRESVFLLHESVSTKSRPPNLFPSLCCLVASQDLLSCLILQFGSAKSKCESMVRLLFEFKRKYQEVQVTTPEQRLGCFLSTPVPLGWRGSKNWSPSGLRVCVLGVGVPIVRIVAVSKNAGPPCQEVPMIKDCRAFETLGAPRPYIGVYMRASFADCHFCIAGSRSFEIP